MTVLVGLERQFIGFRISVVYGTDTDLICSALPETAQIRVWFVRLIALHLQIVPPKDITSIIADFSREFLAEVLHQVLVIQRKQSIPKSFESFDNELYQPCNYHEHGAEIDNFKCASNELVDKAFYTSFLRAYLEEVPKIGLSTATLA
jgi:hypothetical protein